MVPKIFLFGVLGSARLLANLPQQTRVHKMLGRRDATTTTQELPYPTGFEDPWQCVTENITQFFDVPMPTGKLLEGINSFGDSVLAPCRTTATGDDSLYCSFSDPQSWCGFSTAAATDLLVDYSTYVSQAVAFWTAKSAKISVLSTSCPVAWDRPHPAAHEWLKIARAHAQCYLQTHPQTGSVSQPTISSAVASQTQSETESQTQSQTQIQPPMSTYSASSASTTTSTSHAVSNYGRALEGVVLISTGLAMLANTA